MSVPWKTKAQARQRLAVEEGAIVKGWGGRLQVALVFPNSYFVGMSSLGYQAVYSLINSETWAQCERAFIDSPLHAKQDGIVTIESQRELWEFAAIAFALSFELDYPNVIAALEAAGLPPLSADRDESHSLVIAGGPAVTANPEPMSPFIDAIVIGEAEPILPALLAVLRQAPDIDRAELLVKLAHVPGVYVPALYKVIYHDDGSIARFEPNYADLPSPVQRQWVKNLDDYQTSSTVLTRDTEFGDMVLVEVARGCARQCRFCLAGYCFLPKRERSPANVIAIGEAGLRYRKRIGLVGSAVSDYSHIDEVVTELRARGAELAVSSLRVDSLSPILLKALVESGTRTLTMAPEVGSERLSNVIGKGIIREQVLQATAEAAKIGIKRFKLYYMVGLPTEADADIAGIIDLTLAAQRTAEQVQPGSHVSINVGPFVPKAHTPFQYAAMAPLGVLDERLAKLNQEFRRKKVEIKAESPQWAAIQGVLARGDRRLAPVIQSVAGQLTPKRWHKAMTEAGLNEDFYLRRTPNKLEAAPWSIVSTGVVDRYLQLSANRAAKAVGGNGCGGAKCQQCGVCSTSAEAH